MIIFDNDLFLNKLWDMISLSKSQRKSNLEESQPTLSPSMKCKAIHLIFALDASTYNYNQLPKTQFLIPSMRPTYIYMHPVQCSWKKMISLVKLFWNLAIYNIQAEIFYYFKFWQWSDILRGCVCLVYKSICIFVLIKKYHWAVVFVATMLICPKFTSLLDNPHNSHILMPMHGS